MQAMTAATTVPAAYQAHSLHNYPPVAGVPGIPELPSSPPSPRRTVVGTVGPSVSLHFHFHGVFLWLDGTHWSLCLYASLSRSASL